MFELAPRTQVRENIEVWLEDREPTINFAAYELGHDIQDDNLIASIIMFREENPNQEVVLVTSDSGLTLMAKANRLGIPTTKLPDKFKLSEEPDPEQVRINELENELRELKLQVPRLSLVIKDGSQHIVFTIPHQVEPTEDRLENEIGRIKKRYPKIENLSRQVQELPEHLASLSVLAYKLNASLGNTILPEDIEDYNNKLDKFYQAYGEYLKRNIHYQNLKRRTIELYVFVANDGSAPAEDIDVILHFPDGFRLTDAEGYPNSPSPPEPPREPRTQMQKMTESISVPLLDMKSINYHIPDTIIAPQNVSSPIIKRTNSYEVSFHVQRLKHKLQEPTEPLYVIFDSFESAQSFHIDYQILAANVPNEVTGQLHVEIKKE